MKQYWQRLAQKIDALSLRERTFIFATAAILLLLLVNEAFLGPQLAEQKRLARQLQQEQAQIAAIQAEIQQQGKAQETGTHDAGHEHLKILKRQLTQLATKVQETQNKLVSPERMAELLESILKRNGRLQLLSLQTRPAVKLNPQELNIAEKEAAPAVPAGGVPTENTAVAAIYKHAVEVVVQGDYLDMMRYLDALEALPWQLFWDKAQLNMNAYPKATLTLTLYTLNLDEKWLDI